MLIITVAIEIVPCKYFVSVRNIGVSGLIGHVSLVRSYHLICHTQDLSCLKLLLETCICLVWVLNAHGKITSVKLYESVLKPQ